MERGPVTETAGQSMPLHCCCEGRTNTSVPWGRRRGETGSETGKGVFQNGSPKTPYSSGV